MKSYFILSKRGICFIFCFALLSLLVLLSFNLSVPTEKNGNTSNKHITFAENLGYQIDEKTKTEKQIVIPDTFSDVYNRYNQLQKNAGYDLSDYKGCKVTLYTYNIKNTDKVMNILIYSGRIIGGDISDVSPYGNMLGLEKTNGKTTAR